MKITDILVRDAVLPELAAGSKREILTLLAHALASADAEVD
jgi:hypothetical protein